MSDALLEISELLRQFSHSGWRDLYLRTANYSVFAAKTGGGANPMLDVAPDASVVDGAYVLRAPHVGTVGSIARPGQHLRAGDTALTLLVLDHPVEITAEGDGVVASVLAPPGTPVEYDTPLLRLSPAG